MRSGSSLYTNYIYEKDLFPLSKAPNKEHPFKDPGFKVVLFRAVGDYGRYWRDKGYSINVDGEIVPRVESHSSWTNQEILEGIEFHPVNWKLIAEALQKYYRPDGKERI